MNENHEQSSIQQSVLDAIREGKVRPRSRGYFLVRVIAAAITGLALLIFSALVISFIFFTLHESGEQFLFGFGWNGVLVFLLLFPWIPVCITIGLIFLLEWLLQGFSFGYRIPLLNIFLGVVGVSVALGFIINLTPLHSLLLSAADRNQLPVVGDSYEHIYDSHQDQGIGRGIVLSTATSSFTMRADSRHHDDSDYHDPILTIYPAPGAQFMLPPIGARVLILGHPQPNGQIEAVQVQVLPPPPH
jgi:hypothetical protein